jgi:hypothetical protein
MRVKDGDNYVLIGSQGGAPKDPLGIGNTDCLACARIPTATLVDAGRGTK